MAAHSFDDDSSYSYNTYDDEYYGEQTAKEDKGSTLRFLAVIFAFVITLAAMVTWKMYDRAGETTPDSLSQSQPHYTAGRASNEVRQGDEISGHNNCLIGVTDSTKAWVSATCASPGSNVTTAGTAVGVARDMTDNGLIPVALNDGVVPQNMYKEVTVSPYDDNLKGVEVCSMGPDSTVYGCGSIIESANGVGRLRGLDNAPAGAPVWLRSTLSDDKPNAAQLVGIVSVSGNNEKESVVSFIPLDVTV